MNKLKTLTKLCNIEFEKLLKNEKNNYNNLSEQITKLRMKERTFATNFCRDGICSMCYHYSEDVNSCKIRKILRDTGEWPQFIPKDYDAWRKLKKHKYELSKKWHQKLRERRKPA